MGLRQKLQNLVPQGIMHVVAQGIVRFRAVIFVLFALACVYCALSVGRVQLETTLTAFLPDNTQTRQGIVVMEEEFTTYASARVMVSNITYQTAEKLAGQMEKVPHVTDVALDDSATHYAHSSALFSLSFDNVANDPSVMAAMGEVREIIEPFDHYVSTSIGFDYNKQLAGEMGGVIGVAALVIVLILLLTSRSYFEVVVSFIVFAVAALLNMGTNFWLGTISSISNSVAIILQLALAIDYAIILSHRYQDSVGRFDTVEEALVDTLTNAIPEIASSSLTTISGLLALTLMQFGLGPDLGMVLAKGILCSLITVFFLMPGLILVFAKLLCKTAHKPLLPSIEGWGRLLGRVKWCFVWLFCLLVPVAIFCSSQTVWAFNDDSVDSLIYSEGRAAQTKIVDTFDDATSVAVIVPSGFYVNEKLLINELSELPNVKNAMGLASISVDDSDAVLTDPFTPRQFAELLDIDVEEATLLLQAYGLEHEQYQGIFGNASSYAVPLIDLFDYLFEKMDQGVISLGADRQETIDDLRELLRRATDQLRGTEHDRMILTVTVPAEGEESVALVDDIRARAESYYGEGTVLVCGNITSARDLSDSFTSDSMLISLLTALFVLIILLVTFRSVAAALMMVAVIQTAIWINFSFPFLTQFTSSFVTYMICSAIQMGATIDYAIVMMNRYLAARKGLPPKQAMARAVAGAFPTVLTSGLIMTMAGLLIAFGVSDVYVGHMGLAVGRGAIISVILVLTVLPQLMVLLDPWIEKTRFNLPRFSGFKRNKKKPAALMAPALSDNSVAKPLISAALAFVLVTGGLPVLGETLAPGAAYAEEAGEGTAANAGESVKTVHISKASDLQALAKACSVDSYSRNLVVELDADVDLTDYDFAGIPYFAGVFQGNKHKVSGFELEESGSHQGFFRYVAEGAQVNNLQLEGSVAPADDASCVGGLAGSNAGSLLSCTFAGTVSGQTAVGGLVGENTGSVASCSASGTVTGSHQVGGLVGENSGSILNCANKAEINTTAVEGTNDKTSLSGLTALFSGSVASLTNMSEDDILNVTDVGGVAGHNTGVVSSCTNSGVVGYPHLGYNMGGIAGRNSGAVSNCTNYALVQGRKDVGGLVGQLEPYTAWDLSSQKLAAAKAAAGEISAAIEQAVSHARGNGSALGETLSSMHGYSQTASAELENVSRVFVADLTSLMNASQDLIVLARDMSGQVDSAHLQELIGQLEDLVAKEPSVENNKEILAIAGEILKECSGVFNAETTSRLSSILASLSIATPDTTGLFDAWGNMLGALGQAREQVSDLGSTLVADVSNIAQKVSAFGDVLGSTAESMANVNVTTDDVSATEDAASTGLVARSENRGSVAADTNVGGCVGAVAFDLSFDPEDTLNLSDAVFTNARQVVSAVIDRCVNAGDVAAKKGNAGGIAGSMAFGAALDCVAACSVTASAGSYCGGIAGSAQAVLQDCFARVALKGTSYVGGIAGQGKDIVRCSAFAQLPPAGAFRGSIAGDAEGECADNVFVENDCGGIDGISYEGRAVPLSFDELASREGTPDLFKSLTVTFMGPEGVVKTVEVSYGGSYTDPLPAVPDQDNKVWRWESVDLSNVRFSVVVEGAYGNPVTTLGTLGDRPDFLVEGRFSDSQVLKVKAVQVDPQQVGARSESDIVAAGTLVVEGYDQELTVRIRVGSKPCKVYADLGEDGAFQRVDAYQDGSYMVAVVPAGSTVVAL